MEAEFHRWLSDHLPASPRAPLGLADDAAVLQVPSAAVVVTTDLVSDGVDFRLDRDSAARIGRKALAVNLSDLAAMAARPTAAVVSIALPRVVPTGQTPLELAIALYEGLLPLAAEFDVALAGGDTNTHEGPLVLSVTALGEATARGPLVRSGGRPGDWLLVSGTLGGSIAGHHFDFTPRVREALLLAERYELRAGMDISDGLALDASRLAAASGCGAVLRLAALPISAAAKSLPQSVEHALSDGEDFELLLTAAPATAAQMIADQPLACGITCIGELTADAGLWQETTDGARLPLAASGWLH